MSARELSHEQQVLLNWKLEPEIFVRQALGVVPEKWQVEGLNAVRDSDRVCIRSGHGVGKTAFEAWVALWWQYTRVPARTAVTAPTATQLGDVFWGELAKWHRRMAEPLRKLYELKAEHLIFTENPKESYVVARTARKEQPEAFQGLHSENMLFIVDEASGVDDIIFQVGEGSMSSKGAKTLLCGNPTRTSGYFYDAFHSMRGFWKPIRVGCAESSQVTHEQIDRYEKQYGVDSNIYRVRVLGEFPREGDDTVIPLHLIESAVTRDVDMLRGSDPVWGLDVARFGDDRSTLAKRRANHLLEPVKEWRNKDLMQLCGIIVNEYAETKHKPDVIYVDSIGLGAGVADRLAELGLPVMGINVSESSAVGEKFMRLRDELWWKAREWFRGLDVKIPDDDRLIAELSIPTYDFTSGGKIKVESKDEIKKRTMQGMSPDRADSFCLTFAGGFARHKDFVPEMPVFEDS